MRTETATFEPTEGSVKVGSAPSWFAFCDATFVDSLRLRAHQSRSTTWGKIEGKHASSSQFSMIDVALFLEKVYRLCGSDEDGAVDAVYEFMDDCLLDGDFSTCGTALQSANPTNLLHSVILSFLIVTQRAKEKLKESRPSFYAKAVAAVSATHGAEYAEKLLGKNR